MKKIKQNKGFTLVEMLACVVTLFLICMICSTGMNFALRSYQQSVYESDSQMLEATLNMYLCDVLRHATDIKVDASGVPIFTNTAYGVYDGKIGVPDEGASHSGNFLVYENEGGSGDMILSADAYSQTLYIDDFVLTYDESTGVFTGEYKIKSTLLSDVERVGEFVCRTIAK